MSVSSTQKEDKINVEEVVFISLFLLVSVFFSYFPRCFISFFLFLYFLSLFLFFSFFLFSFFLLSFCFLCFLVAFVLADCFLACFYVLKACSYFNLFAYLYHRNLPEGLPLRDVPPRRVRTTTTMCHSTIARTIGSPSETILP